MVITHPCHPLSGQEVRVLHYRRKGPLPAILVELPDLSTQLLPVGWTDRSAPDSLQGAIAADLRLSPTALLELIDWLEKQEKGD